MKRADTSTNFSEHYKERHITKIVIKFVITSSNKLKKFLFEERRLLRRKRIANEITPPAPFYDELHFANYE